MAIGSTKYSDVSSLLNNIYEGALFTLRQQNLLVRTVKNFRDTNSMVLRKNSSYGTANPRVVAEAEDVVATQFTRSALSTLTPSIYADQFFITDERQNSDDHQIVQDASLELGASFAQQVDTNLAGLFSSLTGGTIGSAGGTILWAQLIQARAMMHSLKIPGPYWCALHPYQWMHLVNSASSSGNEIANAPGFQESLVSNYFVSSLLGGVIFVITPSIAVDASDDVTGAMYSPLSMAYDERTPFSIEPERDASRRGWELNATLRYAYGTWAPTRGIQLIGDAATPS